MDTLFGIPTGQLTLVLLGVFVAGALILAFLAARDRTSFRMAIRNIPRRKTQTALIVVGLMLATVLFSAAFTTGDTLTNSLRLQALKNVGRVDVVVGAERPESGGGLIDAWDYFGWGANHLVRYLDLRVALHNKVFATDELEMAGFFIKHGGLEPLVAADADRIQLDSSYSDVFDNIYRARHGGDEVVYAPTEPFMKI